MIVAEKFSFYVNSAVKSNLWRERTIRLSTEKNCRVKNNVNM